MPVSQIRAPASPFGLPVGTNAGLNETICILLNNNTGTYVRTGDVVCWDNSTALSSVTPVLVNANFTLTTASQTITANASTASYAAQGSLLIPATVASGGTAGTLTVPVFVSYLTVTGSTFTGATAAIASVTNGVQANASIYQWPTASYSGTAGVGNTNTQNADFLSTYVQSIAAQPAAPFDGGRCFTYSTTGAVNNPLVAGVLTADGTAATQTGLARAPVSFPGAYCGPNMDALVAVAGVARVNIGAATVASLSLLTNSTIPSQAESATAGTLGNLLGIALEAQSAKDTNNTIRAALKLG